MVKVQFKINEKTVSEKEFLATPNVIDLANEIIIQDMKDDYKNLVCPVHDESPVITVVSTKGNKVKVSVSCCCEALSKLL